MRYSDTQMCKSKSCHHKLHPSHVEIDETFGILPVAESGHTATFPYVRNNKIYCYECAKFCDAPNLITKVR